MDTTQKGSFSVKSFSFELAKNDLNRPQQNSMGLWKGLVPHRVEIFVWLALQEKLHTKDKLARLGIIDPSSAGCSMCNLSQELCFLPFPSLQNGSNHLALVAQSVAPTLVYAVLSP